MQTLSQVYKFQFKAAITCVRKLTDSHPKGVRQNAWYLLHVFV